MNHTPPKKIPMKFPILTALLTLVASWSNLHAQAYLTGSLTNGLVAYYPLNGDANDYSPQTNNGIAHGAYASNGAYYFDGSSYIQAGNILQDYSSNATISCWIMTSASSAGSAVSKQKSYPDGSGLAVNIGGSNTVGAPTNGVGNASLNTEPSSNPGSSGHVVATLSINTPLNVNDNKWHLLTTTVDGKNLNLYLDGLLVSSKGYKSDSLRSDSPMLIGCSCFPFGPGWNIPGYFKGYIKNVMAYNRPLSSKEVASLYSQFRPLPVLVYTVKGSGFHATATSSQSVSSGGYFVMNETNNASSFIWTASTPTKTYSLEQHTNIDCQIAGSGVGASTLFSMALASGSFPQVEKDVIWMSGTNALVALNTSNSIPAPSAMTGFVNTLVLQGGTQIQNQSVTLTLDKTNTLVALTNNETFSATISRLTNSLSKQGYAPAP